jgi:hypothetical protein
MIVLAYLGSQCTTFHAVGGHTDFYFLLFGVVYLAWWDFAMDPTKKLYKIFCKSLKNAIERNTGSD